MAYTKTVWAHDTKITTAEMNNAETQYDEAYASALAHNHDTRYYTKTLMESNFWYAGNDGPGSGCDADLLYYVGGNMHFAAFGTGGIATNTIIMWEGVSIPSGWALCDGTSGTPDLRDKFVLGAGGSYSVGASGGSNTWGQDYTITVAAHTLIEAELPSHTHTFTDNSRSGNTGADGGDSLSACSVETTTSGTTSATGGGLGHGHTGSTVTQSSSTENKPPCASLKYIMKT